MSSSLEAKICVLGAQGVGKTSLVQRYINGTFTPSKTTSTVGASFLTKRTTDIDSGSTVRLQIWDTAGQERFHSITKLYYRGASAVILVYSIVDEKSFVEMGRWLREVKDQLGDDVIFHVVGTKTDVVAQDPSLRQVPFERCIAFIAENLHPGLASTPPPSAGGLPSLVLGPATRSHSPAIDQQQYSSGTPKRSSGFWGNDIGWDICHEISASSGEGIEEVFRVITRKLVERSVAARSGDQSGMSGSEPVKRTRMQRPNERSTGYFDQEDGSAGQSFRPGIGSNRKSWLLGFPTPHFGGDGEGEREAEGVDVRTQMENRKGKKGGGCC